MSVTDIGEWVLSAALLVGIGALCVRELVSGGRRGRLHLLAAVRAPRARRAAIQASVQDPVFDPERIEAAVTTILQLTEELWQGGQALGVRGRPDAAVIRAWAENSGRVVGTHARVAGHTRVQIMGVVNREDEHEDRVVVRVRVHVNRGPRSELAARRGMIDERWTLMRRGEEWYLAADAGDPVGESLLTSPLITSPDQDTARLQEASLEELTERPPRGSPAPAELTDTHAPPMEQLRDLSVADDRFDPALVETALGHIVEAWERSSDGSDAPLLAVATGAGAHALSFPRTGHGRRRVRDARLKRWAVTGLDARATPPTVTVDVRVRAAAWTDADVRAGDDRETRRLDLVWTLQLDEATHDHPRWRLAGSADA